MARFQTLLLANCWAVTLVFEYCRGGLLSADSVLGCVPPLRLSLKGGFSSDQEIGSSRPGRGGDRKVGKGISVAHRRIQPTKARAANEEGKEWGKEVGGLVSEERRKKRAKYHSNILFVGQLPFTATADQVQALFLRRGISSVKVRLLTDKKTKASRGIGFVEFVSQEDCTKALSMDHSLLGGRRIRIERTATGAGSKEKRKGRLKRAKIEQDILRHQEVMKMLREVFDNRERTLTDDEIAKLANDTGLHPSRRPQRPSMKEKDSGGAIRLELSDMDEQVINFLKTLPLQVARRAAKAVARSDMRGVENKGAWIMGMIKRRLRRAEKMAKRMKTKSVHACLPLDGKTLDTGMPSESASEGESVSDSETAE